MDHTHISRQTSLPGRAWGRQQPQGPNLQRRRDAALTSLFSRNLDLSVFCVHAKMPRALTLLIALCITPHPGASAWPTLQPHLLHGGAGKPPRLSRERRVCACSVLPNSCDPVDCSCQAPLSTGFSRQEYQSGLPLPPPDPGSNPPLSPLLHWWVSSRSAPRER